MITKTDESCTNLNLGNVPVWMGVKNQTGFETLPFMLKIESGLIRLDLDVNDLQSVVNRYSLDDYSFITTPPGMSEWGNRLGNMYLEELTHIGNIKGKKVLEIGSGTSYLAEKIVENFQAEKIICCDPAIKTSEILPSVEIVREYFSATLFKNKRIDLIVSINNLEHIPNPWEYLSNVQQLLSNSEGRLFLVVPDSKPGLENGDLGICIHEHFNYFTEESLGNALNASGMNVISMKAYEHKLFVLAEPGISSKVTPKKSKSCSSDALQKFSDKMSSNLRHIKCLLKKLRQNANNKIGIHGCSVGLNNMLEQLKIYDDAQIYLFDSDNAKKGKYLPTFSRPIISSTDPIYNTMTDIIIAVPTFYEEIKDSAIKRHGIAPERVYSILDLPNNIN